MTTAAELKNGKRMLKDQVRFNLSELLSAEFPPLVWYVDRLITPGLTLLWGPSKGGKSILILHIILAVSIGGKALGNLDVVRSSVLFISLEDGPRRLQNRLIGAGAIPNDTFEVFFQWPRGDRGIEILAQYLEENPEVKIVVIDTLGLFARLKDSNDYGETIAVMESLKRVADSRDISIILIHHSKKTGKNDNQDFVESALGSTGIVSGPDHLMYLKRTPSGTTDAVLHFRSKDAEPAEIALNFDKDISGWRYAGEAADLADTDERQEILDLLTKNGAMRTGAIASSLNKKPQTVSYLLQRMLEKGQVSNPSYGMYVKKGT